jgi:excisionase family DNA binding protein
MTVPVTDSVDKLLTVSDLMASLRISRPTLYRLLKSGQLIPVRIGKRTLFDPADIRAFIEASKSGAPLAKKPQAKKVAKVAKQPKSKPRKIPQTQELPTTNVSEKPQKTKRVKITPSDDSDKQGRLL